MKKRITLIIAIVLFTATAMAQDVGPLKESVLKELQRFFNLEQGNRVTEYNMEALAARINAIISRFEEKNKKLSEGLDPNDTITP